MSVLVKLQNQGSSLTSMDGSTPSVPDFGSSPLHNKYSINGEPNVVNKPNPSTLDLDGQTPEQYLNNLPS